MSAPRPVAGERQRKILALLRENGALRIGELTEMFDVSDETVRRDLTALQEQGLLTRTRGGAVAESVHTETSFQRRLRDNQDAKREIARIAASFVQDGSTVIIDSGSTMSHLVSELRNKQDLVVITNGISHVEELLSNPSSTVVVTGGQVRRATLGAVGQLAVEALSALRADHSFLATHSFSADAGMTYPSFDEVAVKRAMISAATEVTLLADGSKCGRVSMVRVAPMSAFTRLITSRPFPDTERSKMSDLGVDVVLAASVEAVDPPDLHLVNRDHAGGETA